MVEATAQGPDGPVFSNAVLAIDGSGRVIGRYAKHHLVPFGVDDGRIMGRIELGETGLLDAALPAPRSATAFARHGQAILAGLIPFCLLGAARLRHPRRTMT